MPPPRHHIGQLLVQLTRELQQALFAGLVEAGYEDARVAHAHVTAYIRAEGSRLTDLAAMARMSLPAMSETVSDLERLGIVERRPDPTDGRAKLICLTEPGWAAMEVAREVIAGLEADFARRVGAREFERTAQTLERLLTSLGEDPPARTAA